MNLQNHFQASNSRLSQETVIPSRKSLQSRHRDEAETMLRDIAYVLHLTRRVRESILQEREPVMA